MKPVYTLYLDMDGVVADLDFVLLKIMKVPADIVHGRVERTPETKEIVHEALRRCVDEGWFQHMPLMPYAMVIEAFVDHLDKMGVRTKWLTSTGNFGSPHEEVERQKQEFILEHFKLALKDKELIAVRGWQEKQKFANGKYTVLLDDSDANIEAFIAAGGVAFLYNPKDTIETLESIADYFVKAMKN